MLLSLSVLNVAKVRRFLVCLFILVFSCCVRAALSPAPISLEQVLALTAKNSPQRAASILQEAVAQQSIEIARANYYPSLTAGAIDTVGSPEVIDLDTPMAFPYRGGSGAGITAEQIIWDFGRTSHQVQAAKYALKYQQENTTIITLQVQQLALKTYYECMNDVTQQQVWRKLSQISDVITNQAKHFVNTGQVSIVDKYLSETETEEARTLEAYYQKKADEVSVKLAAIMSIAPHTFSCPMLSLSFEQLPAIQPSLDENPLVKSAKININVAQEQLNSEKAQFHPKIVAEATGGRLTMSGVETNPAYGVGVGVVLPLVDFAVTSKINQDVAKLQENKETLQAQKQQVQEVNAAFDEMIYASDVRLQHLRIERKLGGEAFNAAKDRYFSLQGNLLDLRAAYRNLARVEVDMINTQSQLLAATGGKALFNGIVPNRISTGAQAPPHIP